MDADTRREPIPFQLPHAEKPAEKPKFELTPGQKMLGELFNAFLEGKQDSLIEILTRVPEDMRNQLLQSMAEPDPNDKDTEENKAFRVFQKFAKVLDPENPIAKMNSLEEAMALFETITPPSSKEPIQFPPTEGLQRYAQPLKNALSGTSPGKAANLGGFPMPPTLDSANGIKNLPNVKPPAFTASKPGSRAA